MKPLLPTTSAFSQPTVLGLRPPPSPETVATVKSTLFVSQALSNVVFMITLLSVVAYFLFSFDIKSKAIRAVSNIGRWLLMIGFGAIFGSTVMMRFTLLIDRMYFIWIEFVQHGLLHMK